MDTKVWMGNLESLSISMVSRISVRIRYFLLRKKYVSIPSRHKGQSRVVFPDSKRLKQVIQYGCLHPVIWISFIWWVSWQIPHTTWSFILTYNVTYLYVFHIYEIMWYFCNAFIEAFCSAFFLVLPSPVTIKSWSLNKWHTKRSELSFLSVVYLGCTL